MITKYLVTQHLMRDKIWGCVPCKRISDCERFLPIVVFSTYNPCTLQMLNWMASVDYAAKQRPLTTIERQNSIYDKNLTSINL